MAAPVLQLKRGLLANLPGLRVGEPGFTTDSYDLYVGIDSTTANNKFFGSHRYWTRGTATTGSGVNLVEGTNNGTDYITLKSPDTLSGIVTYTLPATNGSPASVLTNNGNGILSWSSGSNNATFTGITTFTDGTDNTLGDANTGSVQIDGGVGINKNLTVGANLNVQGYSEFVGVVTFKGGTINLGDATGDNITVGGRFASNLTPNLDNTYDVGISTLNWRNAHFSGIGTFETGIVADGVRLGVGGNGVVDTASGPLYLDSGSGTTIVNDTLNVAGNLNIGGNVTIGGTTVVLTGQDVFIQNKDIVLGYSTNTSNVDNSTDTSANHGGVAVASTEGTPLANFNASGINTLPSTYKQLMWFKSGTLGFSTDAFAFNYGVAIGTTTMGDKVRLAVGSGITMSDTSIKATTFYGNLVGNVSTADQVKTVTASDNNANYYVTFVDANNGSATNESVYTDDGIYYNPGANKLTTQHAEFTGNVLVSGITTITGDLSVNGGDVTTSATTFNLVNGTATKVNFGGAATALVMGAATGITTVRNKLVVGGDLEVDGNDILASDGNTNITLTSNTLTTFAGDIRVNGNDIQASDGNANITMTSNTLTAFAGDIRVNGNNIQSSTGANVITLATNNATFANDVTVSGNLYVNGSTTQVNTTTTTIEDQLLDLGMVDGAVPTSDLNKDIGLLLNYYTTSAKKAAVFWDDSASRIVFADDVTESSGVLTVAANAYASIEIEGLWVNDCAGQSQVISCTGSTRNLENITIDGGAF
jgi:hypothetical protein